MQRELSEASSLITKSINPVAFGLPIEQNNMDIKEICLLIAQLKKENETNSPEEKEFNLKWIEILKESIDKSVRDAMKSFKGSSKC